MLLGEDYQADLPQQQQRPSQPTPAEQQWLQHKALGFGELGFGTLVPEKITTASGYVQWCVPPHPSAQPCCVFCYASQCRFATAFCLQQSADYPTRMTGHRQAGYISRLSFSCAGRRFGSQVLSSKKAAQLGLPSGRCEWQDADINCFASCLSQYGKDFGYIAQQLQPPKSRGEVVIFYYDMWKTRRLPRARQWYNSMKDVSACTTLLWLSLQGAR